MARPVYSESWIKAQGVGTHSSTVVVPLGFTYVVKQLTFYADPFLSPVRGFFKSLDTNATLFAAATNAGIPGWFGFYGAIVFEEGESFRWEVSATLTDGADVSASGYKLSNT